MAGLYNVPRDAVTRELPGRRWVPYDGTTAALGLVVVAPGLTEADAKNRTRARALCAAAGALCHWSYAPSVARHAPKEVVGRNTAPKPWEEEAKAATRLAKHSVANSASPGGPKA